MKIKDGFLLRQIAGSWVIVPIGQRVVEFNGLITLSETGAIVWRMLEKGASIDQIVSAILEEYEIDEKTVREDVQEMVSNMMREGLVE